jgi:hypothetical protein
MTSIIDRICSDDKYTYSVDMMFAYIYNSDIIPIKVKVERFMPFLTYLAWPNNDGTAYSPVYVLEHPEANLKHYNKVINANMSYPIIISIHDRVIDGVHRLARAYMDQKEYIDVYYFDEELLSKFIIYEKQKVNI